MNNVQHDSDCGLHNEPAFPNTQCDCSKSKPPADVSEAIQRFSANIPLQAGDKQKIVLAAMSSVAPQLDVSEDDLALKPCPKCEGRGGDFWNEMNGRGQMEQNGERCDACDVFGYTRAKSDERVVSVEDVKYALYEFNDLPNHYTPEVEQTIRTLLAHHTQEQK